MAVGAKTIRQVALSDSFLKGYDALPQKVRAQVRTQVEMLRENPRHPSLNYEAIKHAGDPRMRSLRVNQSYRIIVAHPDGSGTYILLWVDAHDEAYTWAMRHRLDEGDEHGALAIISLTERQGAPLPEQTPVREYAPDTGVLRACTDEQLFRAGVPPLLVPALRRCATEEVLLDALAALREEVAEAVMCLALGTPLPAEVTPTRGDAGDAQPDAVRPEPEPVEEQVADDLRDSLGAALTHPDSGRRFVVLTTLHELEQALDYPLERWRLFLHPDQRAVVRRSFAGPALVSGGAGTGKTVVGLHRALHLAAEVFTEPGDRVLLTTFTRNLALNLSRLMDTLCGTDVALRERIEVFHIHVLAARLRHLAGESFEVIDEERALQLMADVVVRHDRLGLAPAFYLAEWYEVVQERESLELVTYLQVERIGRGRALSRRQRMAIWDVLAAYGDALRAHGLEDWPTVLRRARELLAAGRAEMAARYCAAIVDEAQDMGAPEMRLLLDLVGQGQNSLVLLGDTRQQIYARGSYVPLLGIAIGRRHVRLRVNYRTSEQIRAAAAAVLRDAAALTGERLSGDDAVSLFSGPTPVIRSFPSLADEQAALVAAIRDARQSVALDEIAVVVRKNSQVAHYQKALERAGIPATRLTADGATGEGVQVGTMHRIKGLEFRAVFVVGCSADVLPQKYSGEDDAAAQTNHEERERHLLYVAMTRARDLLWVSAPGPLTLLLVR